MKNNNLIKTFAFVCVILFAVQNAYAQCTINSCPGGAILTGNFTWTDGTVGGTNGFLSVNGVTIGNIDCAFSATDEVGIDLYVFQLLPDGTRVENCDLQSGPPDNYVFKFPVGLGAASDCSGAAFPIAYNDIYDYRDLTNTITGLELCEGGVYEVVLALYVNDIGSPIPANGSVYSHLTANKYTELNLGSFVVNYTGEFSQSGGLPLPITTATITGPNGETGSINANCGEDVDLFFEGLSYIGRCRDINGDFSPFCDPTDPNQTTGIYSPGIESEVEVFLSYTVNGGAPVIIRDGNSGNPATWAYGGQLSGEGIPTGDIAADECFAGICGLRTFQAPDGLCSNDVVEITLTTEDIFTNQTQTEVFTINYGNAGCCPCTFTIDPLNASYCSGSSINLTGSFDDGTNAESITWTDESGATINPSNFQLTNNTCDVITVTFNATAGCSLDATIADLTDQISVDVYPSDINAFVTGVSGSCSTSVTVDASCGNNVSVSPTNSQTAEAGTSGTHNYTATWNGGGTGCSISQAVTANYDCPPDITCPSSASIVASNNSICGTGSVTITGNLVGAGAGTFNITETSGVITGISEGNPFSLPQNNTCAPITYNFVATAICSDDNSNISETVLGALTQTIIVFPDDISAFVTVNDGTCSTSVTLDSSCTGNVTINPSSSQSAEAGESGTHNYTAVWIGDGNGCGISESLTASYNCPPDITCPSSAVISATETDVCSASNITLNGNFVGAGAATFNITETSGAITGVSEGAAFSMPANNTCSAISYTFNITANCTDDGSIIAVTPSSITVNVYPTNISNFVTANDGTCGTSVTVDPSCGTNVTISPSLTQAASAGESGTHSYAVSWSGGGPACIAASSLTANYNCPPDIMCPSSASIAGSATQLCSGDTYTITGATTGSGAGTFTITESTGAITGIVDGVPFSLPANNSCAPVIYSFNASATCNDDGSSIGGITPVSVTVYPTDISTFVTANDGTCSTSITVDSSCGTNVSIAPSLNQSAAAGATGQHNYTATWTGGGPSCISDVALSANYNCPPDIECPSDAQIAISSTEICSGADVTISGSITGSGGASFTITETTGAVSGIVSNNAFQLPANNTCAPITYNFTASANCIDDGSLIVDELSTSVTVYPTDISSFFTANNGACSTILNVDASCSTNVTVSPATTQNANAGESGTHSYSVTWTGGGPACLAPLNLNASYNCPAEIFCPNSAAISVNTTEVCSGASVTITGSASGSGSATYSITESTGTITGIQNATAFMLPINNSCAPVSYTFTAIANCDGDGSEIPEANAGDLTTTVTVYPADISLFINAAENGCLTSVSVDPSCAGNISVSPPSQQAVAGDGMGIHNYSVSWTGGGPACIADQSISANYNCPCDFDPALGSVHAVQEIDNGFVIPEDGICFGNDIEIEARYNGNVIDLTAGVVDNGYFGAFIIINEPVDFNGIPVDASDVIYSTINTTIPNDGTIPAGEFYVYFIQTLTPNDPLGDNSSCNLIAQNPLQVKFLEEIDAMVTNCSGLGDNEVTITITGGNLDNNAILSQISDGVNIYNSTNVVDVVNSRQFTFDNLPDGNYMLEYIDASNCEFEIPISFNCMITPFDCPTGVTANAISDQCGGATISLDASINNQSAYTLITWTDAMGNAIIDPSNVVLPVNNNCSPQTITYNVTVSCSQDPNFIDLTSSVDVAIYPTDISAFVSAADGTCSAGAIIDATCGSNVSAVTQTFNPGESGTAQIEISYNNGPDCIIPFTIDANYDCPVNVSCTFTVGAETVNCSSNTSGIDTYSVEIPFDNGVDGPPGAGGYIIGGGVNIGDNPMLTLTGTMIFEFGEGTDYTITIDSADPNSIGNNNCSFTISGTSPNCDAPQSCTLTVSASSVSCDQSTSGVDTYTVSVSFDNGIDGPPGAGGYAFTGGTNIGDNPMMMQTGTMQFQFNEGTNYAITLTSNNADGPNNNCLIDINGNSPTCDPTLSCTFAVGMESISCDSNTSGVDTYTVSIPFNNGSDGVPGPGGYAITGGTNIGDNPMTVQTGTMMFSFSEGMMYNISIVSANADGANNNCNATISGNSPNCEAELSCTLDLGNESVICNSNTNSDDTYTVSIPFDNGTDGQPGAGGYSITGGTNIGDNPMTVQSGNMVFEFTEGTDYLISITSNNSDGANNNCDLTVSGTSPNCEQGLSCTLTIGLETVSCTANTSANDNYTVSIPFDNGIDGPPGAGGYIIFGATNIGDSPWTDQTGTMIFEFTEGTNYSININSNSSNTINNNCSFNIAGDSPICSPDPIVGCIDPNACNYNMNADTDDGSCEFLSCADCEGTPNGPAQPGTSCDDGDPTTNGDVYDADCNCVGSSNPGCTDIAACNYSADATVDDGSCEFLSCADCEGNPNGNALPGTPCDDGDSSTLNDTYSVDCVCLGESNLGCTDPCSSNFNPSATEDDGTCILQLGCTNPSADNYDPTALCDDGSCTFAQCNNNAGIMSTASQFVCFGSFANAPSSGAVVDPGSALYFVLHNGFGANIGNILEFNNTGTFINNGSIPTNTELCISAAVGVPQAGGLPDFNADCVSISENCTPVTFLDEIIIESIEYCDPNTGEFEIEFVVTGGGPAYLPDVHTFEINGDFNGIVENGVYTTAGVFPNNYVYTLNVANDGKGCAKTYTSLPIQCKTLPVELIEFNGEVKAEGNLLKWVTASEIDNDYFELAVQESQTSFRLLTTVKGAGTTSDVNTYSYLDTEAQNGLTTYQLSQKDFDGTTLIIGYVDLVRSEKTVEIISVSPIPATSNIDFTFESNKKANGQMKIYNATGKLMDSKTLNIKNGLNQYNIDIQQFSVGVYFITIQINKSLYTRKFIKE